MPRKLFAIAVAILAVSHSSARAKVVLDVTTSSPGSVTATAALGGSFTVTYTETQPTGTGVIDPFLTIQLKDYERGYNTDASPEPLDTKRSGGGFNRAIQLGDIQSVSLGGVGYLVFLLDVNQANGNGPISLNQVQFFVSPADVGGTGFSLAEADQGSGNAGSDALIGFSSATEVFRLNDPQNNGTDLATNKEIQVAGGHGSGSGDMFLYVQSSLFGNDPNAYVTLFSSFGSPTGIYPSSAGFEEWSYRRGDPSISSAPEPGTLAMAITGLGALGFAGLRRRKARA